MIKLRSAAELGDWASREVREDIARSKESENATCPTHLRS